MPQTDPNEEQPEQETPDRHGLGQQPEEDVSLRKLSEAYAEMLGAEDVASDGAMHQEALDSSPVNDADEEDEPADAVIPMDRAGAEDEDPACEISPRTILEAMLFVGSPGNRPLTSRQVAARMRGVSPKEIDQLVRELNATYQAEGCPYTIVSTGEGYRMVLREEFSPLKNKFYGRIREARLSQAAIDVLALVAYRQPLSREQVDELRGKASGSILTQLVRRQLLRIERPEERPRAALYYTTNRFLDLFDVDNLSDLPQSRELE